LEIALLGNSVDLDAAGVEMQALADRLYPICRSITGDGVRQTLAALADLIPVEIREVPSGTPVFDWTVPLEWNIRDAWISDSTGRRVVDFRALNLHVVGYSAPVRQRVSLEELRPRLFTIPEQPERVPYRTSYYNATWGFCVSQRQLEALTEPEYEVCIDSTLAPGHLTYGECLLPGQTPEEVLISCHVCHPSLANDNLSGIALATLLAKTLAPARRRYTYRFLFIPGTIGSITWLARNEETVPLIRHGLVLSCVGDAGQVTYKRSRRANAEIDRAVEHVLRQTGEPYEVRPFIPWGYDERQFCSPGFDLPVGCFMRTPNGEYPEYHTSGDDLSLIRPEALADSLRKVLEVLKVLEGNRIYLNRNPKCEPQLGKRGLYDAIGGRPDGRDFQMAMLWVLNLSDGEHSLLEIADRAGKPFRIVREAADALEKCALLEGLKE
jgi:aminopeptidase-like protein